jgi:hypothetical protein
MHYVGLVLSFFFLANRQCGVIPNLSISMYPIPFVKSVDYADSPANAFLFLEVAVYSRNSDIHCWLPPLLDYKSKLWTKITFLRLIKMRRAELCLLYYYVISDYSHS